MAAAIIHPNANACVTKDEILEEYRTNPDAIQPEFASLEGLVDLYLSNPGFHCSFDEFMVEWQEEDNAVECEF